MCKWTSKRLIPEINFLFQVFQSTFEVSRSLGKTDIILGAQINKNQNFSILEAGNVLPFYADTLSVHQHK